MTKKQLSALFLCSLVPWVAGNGVVPLLPVYAAELGAAPALIGYYLSSSYLALAIGTVAAGWLSDRFQRRKTLLIVAGLAAMPGVWLTGQVTNIWQLIALGATTSFLFGVGITLIGILAGLFAEETERGKVFGILSMTGALGSLIGGLTTGPMADRWGYPIMFAVLSLFLILWPVIGLLVEDKAAARVRDDEASRARERPGLGGSFYLLFLASIIASIALFVGIMGRSLAMKNLGLVAAAISSTAAIGGAVTVPLPPLIGWLSDRVGRKRCLALCYLAGTASLSVLAASVSLWHFWVAASLLAVLTYGSGGVGSALVTDLVPQESLGRGMSLFSATTWVGGIIGYASTGNALQNLGMITTFIVGAFLPLIAIALLIPIRQVRGDEGLASHSRQSAA